MDHGHGFNSFVKLLGGNLFIEVVLWHPNHWFAKLVIYRCGKPTAIHIEWKSRCKRKIGTLWSNLWASRSQGRSESRRASNGNWNPTWQPMTNILDRTTGHSSRRSQCCCWNSWCRFRATTSSETEGLTGSTNPFTQSIRLNKLWTSVNH